jgi:hypothetical protein
MAELVFENFFLEFGLNGFVLLIIFLHFLNVFAFMKLLTLVVRQNELLQHLFPLAYLKLAHHLLIFLRLEQDTFLSSG